MIKKIGDFTKLPSAFHIKTLPTLVVVLGVLLVAVAVFGSFGIYIENNAFIYIVSAYS